MSKFNLKGANINATNLYIGDNYNYSSSHDFIRKNENLSLTETEIKLVKIIFDNTVSEEERKSILESLISIKKGDGTDEENKASILSFKPFLTKLNEIGEKIGIGIAVKFITDFASQHNLTHLVDSIKAIV